MENLEDIYFERNLTAFIYNSYVSLCDIIILPKNYNTQELPFSKPPRKSRSPKVAYNSNITKSEKRKLETVNTAS